MSASSLFDLFAPQYATDPGKDDFIIVARTRVTTCFYGSTPKSEQAVALIAAHLMTLAKTRPSGEAGNLQSKREGDLSASYFNTEDAGADDLGMTKYGKQLMGLRRGSGPFIGVTGGNDNGC